MGDSLTIRQLKLPVKIVLFNNGSLGFVEVEMKAAGLLEYGTTLDNPDFAKMAETIGIRGIRVEAGRRIQADSPTRPRRRGQSAGSMRPRQS